MNKAIRESKIQWASITLHKYFGDYAYDVYEALDNYIVNTVTHPDLNSCMPSSTLCCGERVIEKNLAVIETAVFHIYEAYKILLTVDVADAKSFQIIQQDIDEKCRHKLKCLTKWHGIDCK